MIRVAGFILGVVLVVTAFLLVLRPEEVRRPGIRVTSEPMQTIKEHVNPWLMAGEAENNDLALNTEGTEPVASPDPESQEDGVTEMEGKQAGITEDSMLLVHETDRNTESPMPEPVTVYDDTGTKHVRHLFWSPFRSEWAAQGFAGRLAVVSNVPVEVVEEGPGKYRVGFSYRDETERRVRIDRIESITGLQLE